MSKQITEKPADFCLPNCKHMQLSVNTHFAFADNEVCLTATTLKCDHEDVCKMWADKNNDS